MWHYLSEHRLACQRRYRCHAPVISDSTAGSCGRTGASPQGYSTTGYLDRRAFWRSAHFQRGVAVRPPVRAPLASPPCIREPTPPLAIAPPPAPPAVLRFLQPSPLPHQPPSPPVLLHGQPR